jgi:hypothetical protein
MAPYDNSHELPSYRRPELQVLDEDLCLVSDLLGGTRSMFARSTKYIRKWRDEDQSVYDLRRTIEPVYEGFTRVIAAAVGMLFAKYPQITWNAAEETMKPQWDNIDGAGNSGPLFVKRLSDTSMSFGLGVILVDHPPAPADVVITAANEAALGLRPTWAWYSRQQVLSWRTERVGGQLVLTQLVLEECGEEAYGVFGVIPVTKYRVLRLVDGEASWTVWRAKKPGYTGANMRKDDFTVEASGYFRNKAGKVKDSLPVSIAYAGPSTAPLTAKVPLMGVAWANLAHWQQSSNLRFYRDLSAFPQPVISGTLSQEEGPNGTTVPGKLRVGPMVVVHLTEGGTFEWREVTGSAMVQIENGINQEEKQMAQQGMTFLAKVTRAPETAESKRIDSATENSTLATCAQGIEDAVNLAFEHHAWYLGIEKAGAPVITLNRDFENIAMDAPTMAVYVQAVRDAGLPPRLLLEAWQQGGRIAPDVDLEELELEMLANAQAAQDAAAANAQNQGTPPLSKVA